MSQNPAGPELPHEAGAPRELDFSNPGGDDFAALSRDRIPVRSLEAGDLAALVRIDRHITGRDRMRYYERKVTEALEETGIRVSLVAEIEGRVAGFVMANVHYGEFGRAEAEAVIHTIGVDPAYNHRRVGSALLSQLLANLASLRIESIGTEVDWRSLDLIGFLARCGFKPSQRIALARRLS